MADTNIPQKRCAHKDNCVHPLGSWQPATIEYFGRDKSKKDGLNAVCKACVSAYQKARNAANPEANRNKVKDWKKNNPDKVAAQRKKDQSRSTEWHRKDKLEHPEKYAKYAEDHAEEIAANKRLWRKNNPDKVKKHKSDSQKRNRPAAVARVKRWNERHPDKVRALGRVNQHRRNHLPGKFTVADIELQKKAQTGKDGVLRCWWCSKPIPETITQSGRTRIGYDIDHRIAVARGGTNDPGNLCLSCVKCNDEKQDMSPGEFNGRLL